MKLGPNQKKWIAALRSGKYRQTRGRLNDADGFCCLGVACDVFDPTGWKQSFPHSAKIGVMHIHGSLNTMPSEVVDFYGFYDCLGGVYDKLNCFGKLKIGNGVIYSCVDMNDDRGMMFDEIADVIERHPEKFFRESR